MDKIVQDGTGGPVGSDPTTNGHAYLVPDVARLCDESVDGADK
jgi:hypothetical protein